MTPQRGGAGRHRSDPVRGAVVAGLAVLSGMAMTVTLASVMLGSAVGAAGLLAVATTVVTAMVTSLAADRLLWAARAARLPAGPAPTRWRERAHRLWVPRTSDPDAAGQRRPRAPSALTPAA